MDINEPGSNRFNLVGNVLGVIWLSLFITTVLLFPIVTIVPKGPTLDLLKIVFIVVGMTMLALAALLGILLCAGVVYVPRISEPEMSWPLALSAGFVLACIIASTIVTGTADRAGTNDALVQLGIWFGILLLPFILFAIIVPLIIGRFSENYTRKARQWGYAAAMLIDFGMWAHKSGLPTFRESIGIIVLVAVCLIYLAFRHRRGSG